MQHYAWIRNPAQEKAKKKTKIVVITTENNKYFGKKAYRKGQV